MQIISHQNNDRCFLIQSIIILSCTEYIIHLIPLNFDRCQPSLASQLHRLFVPRLDALAIMDILIQRLENTDLSVELADEAPGAVNRQRLLDDAKRRWDLGFYKEALSLYRRAQGIQDDLSVAIKIGGLLLSQGCDPLAIEELETALQKFGDNPDETAEVVATASILLEMLRGQSRLRYRGALQLALQHFGTYVRPLPVSEWRDHKVCEWHQNR